MIDCLFCKIAAKKIPAAIVCEDDEAIAFDDINPRAPVHTLIIAKDHAKTNLDWIGLAKKIAQKKGIARTGYRLIINQGQDARQEIDHLHMHILGGKDLGPMISI